MIKFRQKVFGGASAVVKEMSKTDKFYKYGLPTIALGVSTGSLALSAARNKQMKEQSRQQLAAMDRLSRSLSRVDKSLLKNSESFDKYSTSLQQTTPTPTPTPTPISSRNPSSSNTGGEPRKKRGIFNLF